MNVELIFTGEFERAYQQIDHVVNFSGQISESSSNSSAQSGNVFLWGVVAHLQQSLTFSSFYCHLPIHDI